MRLDPAAEHSRCSVSSIASAVCIQESALQLLPGFVGEVTQETVVSQSDPEAEEACASLAQVDWFPEI